MHRNLRRRHGRVALPGSRDYLRNMKRFRSKSRTRVALTALDVMSDGGLRAQMDEWHAAGKRPWREGLER